MSSESRYETDYSTKGTIADLTASFAGILLIVTASMDILQGVAAIANDDLYSQGSDYLYKFNMTTWGWIHVVLGVVGIVVAVGILRRTGWGQVGGMIVAGLGILTNFAALPRYPLWAIVVIAFYALVIWSLSTQLKHYR
jgi:dolichyl-phosphate-mannose--protein O-mannosyl transferase